jgi:hypothetical protein
VLRSCNFKVLNLKAIKAYEWMKNDKNDNEAPRRKGALFHKKDEKIRKILIGRNLSN